MLGYRRPKYIRDLLVSADVPYREGDEGALPPTFVRPAVPSEDTVIPPVDKDMSKIKHMFILVLFLLTDLDEAPT